MQSTIRLSALCFLLLSLIGCAAPPAKKDPRDPWERMNRTTYNFNTTVDHAVLRPVARGYQKITPGFVRTGVSNFVDNLGYPIVILNDLLQARFTPFARDTGRFLMNSTLGIAGLLDPASEAGLEKHENDFGLTFGYWGIPKGPYFVIPFLGSSDVRDGLGRIPSAYIAPQNFVNNSYVQWGVWTIELVDTRYRLLSLDALVDSSYDPYLFVKNAYLQRRDFLLSQSKNKPSSNESDAEKLLDEATKEEEQESQPAQGQPTPEQPKSDQAKPDEPKSDPAKPDQANPDQPKADQQPTPPK
jgi:phospholipid-binding lipoprotein MlaA